MSRDNVLHKLIAICVIIRNSQVFRHVRINFCEDISSNNDDSSRFQVLPSQSSVTSTQVQVMLKQIFVCPARPRDSTRTIWSCANHACALLYFTPNRLGQNTDSVFIIRTPRRFFQIVKYTKLFSDWPGYLKLLRYVEIFRQR